MPALFPRSPRSLAVEAAILRGERASDIRRTIGASMQLIGRSRARLRAAGRVIPSPYPLCQTCKLIRVRKPGRATCYQCTVDGALRIRERECSTPGCERDAIKKGRCRRCYEREHCLSTPEKRRKHVARVRAWHIAQRAKTQTTQPIQPTQPSQGGIAEIQGAEI